MFPFKIISTPPAIWIRETIEQNSPASLPTCGTEIGGNKNQ